MIDYGSGTDDFLPVTPRKKREWWDIMPTPEQNAAQAAIEMQNTGGRGPFGSPAGTPAFSISWPTPAQNAEQQRIERENTGGRGPFGVPDAEAWIPARTPAAGSVTPPPAGYQAPNFEEAFAPSADPVGTQYGYFADGTVRRRTPAAGGATAASPAMGPVVRGGGAASGYGGGYSAASVAPARAPWTGAEIGAFRAVYGADPDPNDPDSVGFMDSLRGGLEAGEEWAEAMVGRAGSLPRGMTFDQDDALATQRENDARISSLLAGMPQPGATNARITFLPASDGQTLATQSPETQAAFRARYGDQAGEAWAAEHERELAALPRPRMAPAASTAPSTTPQAPLARLSMEDAFLPSEADIESARDYLKKLGVRDPNGTALAALIEGRRAEKISAANARTKGRSEAQKAADKRQMDRANLALRAQTQRDAALARQEANTIRQDANAIRREVEAVRREREAAKAAQDDRRLAQADRRLDLLEQQYSAAAQRAAASASRADRAEARAEARFEAWQDDREDLAGLRAALED